MKKVIRTRRSPTAEVEADPVEKLAMLLGRPHSGKTTLVRQVPQACELLLSGAATFGVHQTGTYNRQVIQQRQLVRQLRGDGVPTTIYQDTTELSLYVDHRPRATLHLMDTVGQDVIDPRLAGRERTELIERAACMDLLLMAIGCPASLTRDSVARFREDIGLSKTLLREVLRKRPAELCPCSVAIVLTRADAVARTKTAASPVIRALIDRLEAEFWPVVDHPKVCEAMIVPVSAMGFNTSDVRAVTREQDVAGLNCGEPEWILRPDCQPTPFNVGLLVLWCVWAALRQDHADEVDDLPARLDLCRSLNNDMRPFVDRPAFRKLK